jgi:pSer/pThr/pTyr-binding forkhead associated (FHA) protein
MPVSADHTIADPVVGWLVVVEGPGRGAALTIGYGNNRIGRAPTENVSLDFGDEQISRENHATITFDGRHRRFYMLPGHGRNLVYVNEEPVMQPIELKGGEEILLGATKLRFVPFCSKAFDWYQK